MRKCSFCGDVLTGRSDKKFCDDICRNNFHYQIFKDKNKKIKIINKILLNNRDILSSFIKGVKTIVDKQELINAGFNCDYFTGIYRTKMDNIFYIIYDKAYCFIEDNKIMLINYSV